MSLDPPSAKVRVMFDIIYGGSFNPFGRHHLAAATWIAADPQVRKVWIVPAAAHAHKTYTVPFWERMKVIQVSLSKDSKIEASSVEQGMLNEGHEGPIYTYNVLKRFQEGHPNRTFKFAIGPDLIDKVGTWHLGDKVRDEFGFYTLPNAGPGRSTTIRNLISKGDPSWKQYMVDGAVEYLKVTPSVMDAYRAMGGPLEQSFQRT